jgi:hypothetical protein
MSRSFGDYFIAPPDASPREVRHAGAMSFAVGVATAATAFVLTAFDARWTDGAILRTRARLLVVVIVACAYVLAAQGLFRWITGIARGADEGARSTAGHVGRIAFALIAGCGLLASIVASLAAITPSPPVEPASRGLDLAVPSTGVNEVRYNVGDATVTITRVQHDASRADGGNL